MSFNKKKVRGFTVAELLVAIAIFLTLTGVVVVSFRNGEYLRQLQLQTQKLASDIRQLQTIALSGTDFFGNQIGAGGLGVQFTNNDTNYYFINDTAESYGFLDSSDQILKTITLDPEISDLQLSTDQTNSLAQANMVFSLRSSFITLTNSGGDDISDEMLIIEIIHSKISDKKGVVEILPASGRINSYIDENN